MLAQLWRQSFGKGVIDTNVDPATQSIALGDLSGRFAVVDYYGNILFEQSVTLPIWGIAHRSLGNGVIATVIAAADKGASNGEIIIFHDDEVAKRIEVSAPAWDTTFLEDGSLVAVTDWSGSLRLVDPLDGNMVKEATGPSSLFGLIGDRLDNLFVCADRNGIYKYDFERNQLRQYIECSSACYNLARSPRGGWFCVGSHGPTFSVFDNNGVEISKTDANGVIAVKFFESLLLYGGEQGEIAIRSVQDFDRDLARLQLNAAVWNISIDRDTSTAFVALGDGSVAAFQIEIDSSSVSASESFLEKRKSESSSDFLEVLNSGVHPAFLTSAILEDLDKGVITGPRAEEIYSELAKNSSENLGPEFSVILGVLALSTERIEEAIEHLANIDRRSSHYSLALTLQARAFAAAGRHDDASRLLAKHLEQLDPNFQSRALGVIRECEDTRPSENLGKIITQANRSHSNRPEALTRVVNDDVSVFLSKNAAVDSEGEVDYGLINYIKYEFASRADHAKKLLEMAVIDELMIDARFATRGTPVSLDIGCATCRWPKYFSSKGFLARGYDVDPEAVRICENIAKGNDRIEIELRNVLESPAETDRYALISSMMGTFNHIAAAQQHEFVEWIMKSLRLGGIAVFSSWNADCEYTSHLQFYRSEERRSIRENSRSKSSLEHLIKDVGLLPRAIVPFTFLPDECYEAWMEHVVEQAIVDLDAECRKHLPASHAQMLMCIAEKV